MPRPSEKKQSKEVKKVEKATPPPPAQTTVLLAITATVLTLICLATTVYAYKRTLGPLYGSGPTGYLLDWVLVGTILVAAARPLKLSVRPALATCGIIASVVPTTAYWAAVYTARRGDPIWGPVITHLAVLSPLVYVAFSLGMRSQLGNNMGKALDEVIIDRFMKIAIGGVTLTLLPPIVELFPLATISEHHIVYCVSGIFLSCAYLSSSTVAQGQKSSSGDLKVLFAFALLAIIAAVQTSSSSVHGKPFIHPSYPLQILSSKDSVTGRIVVGQTLPRNESIKEKQLPSMRYLRAAHSFLGGVWIRDQVATLNNAPPAQDAQGELLGDSIYSTFVLQEAARLVDSTTTGQANQWESALIVGLGAGISASAFARHGMTTTTLEIDPEVYYAARDYFGLEESPNGSVHLEDARGWVHHQRALVEANSSTPLYDIIIHDCFSGGGVPKHLYTTEFFGDLKAIMSPEGVLAVNFAGKTLSDASRGILFTLEKIFGQCRAFYDLFEDLPVDKYETEFINIVFFCAPSSTPLTFRKGDDSDYLNSYLRNHVLSSLDTREIDLALVRESMGETSFALYNTYNPLDKWQQGLAFEHWQLMRSVFPDVMWESY